MSNEDFPIGDEDLQAYVDGALPEEKRLEFERRLERDPVLAERVAQYFALNSMLHARYDSVLTEPVPSRLRPGTSGRRTAAVDWRRWGGMAAALVLGIGIGAGLGAGLDGWRAGPVADAELAERTGGVIDVSESFARQSAIAHVIYAPEVRRPVEVGVDREQELVKWVSNRLGADVRPPVLTGTGFTLMGGRLLPGSNGPVAQFMYHDANGERITLCISHRALAGDMTAFKLYRDGPVNVFYWIDGNFGYAVSGGIDRTRLLALAHDVYAQLTRENPRRGGS
ncbi:anti-sigma factor RsiW [Cupriavidus gilardii J11]|uniref:Anti-sigma factor RsiW n=1 Tax=Cupriavidus gilardii J11 TaxID=936133 RepID=A0A562BG40_9BURK|nr:anti-sigma factor [Cupriavidus gilardii]TWG83880.1 anti-sigma factor RsiW [Cupriavidus gilardii J11]